MTSQTAAPGPDRPVMLLARALFQGRAQMDFAKFYDGMRNHGVLERIDAPALDPKAELWKTQHLLAMAQLARDRDPALAIDDTLGPRELFRALGGVIELESSVLLNLGELLLVLESLDPRHMKRPTWLRTRGDHINYRAVLELALFKAEERFPWRVRCPQPPLPSRPAGGDRDRRPRTD